MKRFLFLFLFAGSLVYSQNYKFGEAKGLFMGVSVGPQVPISSFADNQNLGAGFNFSLSYTDNIIAPFFLYGRAGFAHFPGASVLYRTTDYSSFSSNLVIFSSGIRYFFEPVIKDVVLLMPIVEVGGIFSYWEKTHEFKIDSARPDKIENIIKFGGQIGAGFSMFLLDVIGYYNYIYNNQFLSFELRVRIPAYVAF